ncbi:TPA: hypothetical protein N0F65_007291 [Lagenidium giganteum]|uniref:Poly [ADP-ribose] polymerase n=1 Tax=Lagenidium giganteum TaxID=4803 RepID=A0AAV2Z7L8_9STRA|nr:TPA: hypothetical protein N0F65_007291 [Lagenidium giganteum]
MTALARQAKRKWEDVHWEVVMEAQTFVAVYAAPPEDGAEDDAEEEEATGRGGGRRKKKKAASKTKKKKTKPAPRPKTTRRLKRRKAREEEEEEEDDEMEDSGGASPMAVDAVVAPGAAADEYWLAQLQDDVTEDMIESDSGVLVTWLNKSGNAYQYAYDDRIDVQTILCSVYLIDLGNDTYEITPKSLARIDRSLRRTKGEDLPEDEEDDERPPPGGRMRKARSKGRKRGGSEDGDDDDDGERTAGRRSRGGGGGRRGGLSTPKLTKRQMAMHVPPRYATVEAAKYTERELAGTHDFEPIKDDVVSNNREVLRAVLTKNHKLLKKLVENTKVQKQLSSYSTKRSADSSLLPLQIAFLNDDVTSAALLIKTRTFDSKNLAKAPEISVPSHSTGAHTSAYSDYNRRAINASRGGKEGNNALMDDSNGASSQYEDESFFWGCINSSIKMLTVLYPAGDWTSGNVAYHVRGAAASGNYRLCFKLVETLNRNGGWGFNDLHCKVLSPDDEELPQFRNVSATKQAFQTKIRPIHLAAINPNVKYLKAMWDAAGDEFSNVKDDSGFEPVHFAAACEGVEPLKFLLGHNVSLFARNKKRQTPIMRALVTKREDNAVYILQYASDQGEEVVGKVIAERGPGSFQAIHYAALRGCVRVIEELIKYGADINSVCTDKMTPLCIAAREGHYDCVKVLLDHGAKVDMGNKLKKTPLMFAVKNGNTRIAALLINHGANVNAYDTSDNTVVHYAAAYGWRSCLELLADAGADFWVRNSWGFVPLICALLKQRLVSSMFILERDTKQQFLDFRDRQGCTMLFLQCKHSTNLSQIEYLLDKGLSPNVSNSEGEFPLQTLITRSANYRGEDTSFFRDAIKLLLKHGAKAEFELVQRKRGSTEPVILQPLQLAIVNDQQDVFELLLKEFGANPNAKSNIGTDAWLSAMSMGRDGSFYLKTLLDHCKKSLDLSATTSSKKNIFHFVADKGVLKLADPSLVRQCVKLYRDSKTLINQKDSSGFTPLMLLLSKERPGHNEDPRNPAFAEKLEEAKRNDTDYCDMVDLFAEHTTGSDSLMFTIAREIGQKNPQTSTEDADSGGHQPAESDDDDDDFDPTAAQKAGSNEEDENDDDNGSDEQSDDSDDDNDEDEDQQMEQTNNDDEETPTDPTKYEFVESKTVLHWAAHRRLTSDKSPLNKRMEWYGRSLIDILLHRITFAREILNFPDLDKFQTALGYAVESKDTEGVRLLLEQGADPNHSPVRCKTCEQKHLQCTAACAREPINTPLCKAVRNLDIPMIKELLKHGAKVDGYTGAKDTPLHLAMRADHGRITEILLERNADLTFPNKAGSSPLHVAIVANKTIPSKQVHEGEVTYTNTTETSATQSAFPALVMALKTKKAQKAVIQGDGRLQTPIHHAAAKRDLTLLEALVRCAEDPKAAVNISDEFGRTPLHFAVNAAKMNPDASFEVERFLLQSGANANAVDKFKFTVLHLALFKVDFGWQHSYELSKDAAEANAEREAGTYDKKKAEAFRRELAIIPSSESDPVETISNLAAVRGINVTIRDELGRTPLHLACATGAFVCTSTLLSVFNSESDKRKALEMKDNEDFTALARAVKHLRQPTIMTLIQAHADISARVHSKIAIEGSEAKIKSTSLFYHAVSHRLTGICHMLLNAKFPRRQAMEDALLCGQFQLARNLMIGTEVSNDPTLLTRTNDAEETLLHALAKVKKPFDDLARLLAWTLVGGGISAKQKSSKGNTALHYAAKNANTHLMDFLLHNKCEMNQANNAGETPLLYAIKRSKADVKDIVSVIEYFFGKSGFNVHVKDRSGMNVLTAFLDRFADRIETQTTYFRWMEQFLKKGIDANGLFTSMSKTDFFENETLSTSTTTKVTALIRASYMPSAAGRANTIGMLLRYGAKVTALDEVGNSLLTHLATRNMSYECKLVLGKVSHIRDPTDKSDTKMIALHVPPNDIRTALQQTNKDGQTTLHCVVKPLSYGSYENAELLGVLVSAGGSLTAKDRQGRSVIDYTCTQSSRFLFRFLRKNFPRDVKQVEAEVFDSPMEEWPSAPSFAQDAATYLAECEQNGKIKRKRQNPEVNGNCDVGRASHVHGPVDEDGKIIEGEEYNALLTKVDVKNGRFGLNVFYQMQIAHDEIQDIYVLFTNWGRIGEVGKYQNTPFHSAADAVSEFKKIFKSKTGNEWESRLEFEKKAKRYNLIQRINFHTEIDQSVTCSFADAERDSVCQLRRQYPKSVSETLAAITDIRNLQLAASEQCGYHDGLPLAKQEEILAALEKLKEIRKLLENRDEMLKEITKLSGDITDEGTAALTDLSNQHSDLTEEISEKSSRYYEVMPCNEDAFGSSIRSFDSIDDVNREINRLRTLIDITETYKILLGAKLRQRKTHPIEYCHDAMQVNVSAIGIETDEGKLLKQYFFNGLAPRERKSYRISNVYAVSRKGEHKRYLDFLSSHPSFKEKHSALLWHGTRRTNLMGILTQGLRIAPPEAPHQGYAFGKGLYFANVSAKSLGYCDSPYSITSEVVGADGKKVKKTRQVRYLLLCEVALGNPTEEYEATFCEKVPEGTDSVKGMGKIYPDARLALVSPESGAKLEVGKVGEEGVDHPMPMLWAMKAVEGEPDSYWDRIHSLGTRAQQYLNKIVSTMKEGETHVIEKDEESTLFINQYSSEKREITIELESKSPGIEGDFSPHCEVTIKLRLAIPNSSETPYTISLKRYRNIFLRNASKSLPEGYTTQTISKINYDELIVYNESQARIRYLIEVEDKY